jgi:hypothetical protein
MKTSISNKAELDAAIRELESKRVQQEQDLVNLYQVTRESLSPMNLIKEGFSRMTSMPNFQDGIIKTVTGIGAGVLSKKLFLGGSSNIIKKLLSNVVEFAVAKSTISNADKIKAFGISVYHNLFKKNHKPAKSSNKENDLPV